MNFMKVVGIGCLGCLGLIVILGIVGFVLLPKDFEVERSTIVAAPATAVFPLVDTPRRWPEWDPWMRLDPKMTNEFSGPESGLGAKRTWVSENQDVGRGSFTIVESRPNEHVALDLELPDMEMTMRTTFTFETVANGTRVTWRAADELSGPWRFVGIFADAILGPMYEDGLSNLKEIAERETSLGNELLDRAQKAVDGVPTPTTGDEQE